MDKKRAESAIEEAYTNQDSYSLYRQQYYLENYLNKAKKSETKQVNDLIENISGKLAELFQEK